MSRLDEIRGRLASGTGESSLQADGSPLSRMLASAPSDLRFLLRIIDAQEKALEAADRLVPAVTYAQMDSVSHAYLNARDAAKAVADE